MQLSDVQFIFNRALTLTFIRKKLFLTFVILAMSGLLIVFFRGIAVNAGQWIAMSMVFIPIFLCAGVLLSLGILLIRIYHDEIKKKPLNYSELVGKSWEIVMGASYFSIPIILSYLMLWMLLGIFFLLEEIPALGNFFSVILVFAPFLINLGTLVLCILNISMLFFCAPVIALKGLNRIQVTQTLVKRFKNDIFSNLFLVSIATLPLIFIVGLLILAGFLTGAVCYTCESPTQNVLQWFFIMIPFTAVLTPAVVFFFNFAAESHVLIMKELRSTK